MKITWLMVSNMFFSFHPYLGCSEFQNLQNHRVVTMFCVFFFAMLCYFLLCFIKVSLFWLQLWWGTLEWSTHSFNPLWYALEKSPVNYGIDYLSTGFFLDFFHQQCILENQKSNNRPNLHDQSYPEQPVCLFFIAHVIFYAAGYPKSIQEYVDY